MSEEKPGNANSEEERVPVPKSVRCHLTHSCQSPPPHPGGVVSSCDSFTTLLYYKLYCVIGHKPLNSRSALVQPFTTVEAVSTTEEWK